MLLIIANLTNGLRGLKHNDDVQSIDPRLPTRNSKLLIDVDAVKNSSSIVTLTLLQKYQRSKGDYRVYSARLMASGAILHKAIFVCETKERRRSSTKQIILKGDKKMISLASIIFDIHQILIS